MPVRDLGLYARRQIPVGAQLGAARAQHLAREISGHHPGPGDAPGDFQRAVEGARAKIQQARRRAQTIQKPSDRLASPQEVDARRHHPVGGVVARRNPIEHLLNVRG